MSKSIKSFLVKRQKRINAVLLIGITACIFYSGVLEQRISEIYTNYVIATNTLNNSFITLAVSASIQDDEAYQKTKDSLNEQMIRFNEDYEKEENERKHKKAIKHWIDIIIYIFMLSMFIFNIVIPDKK